MILTYENRNTEIALDSDKVSGLVINPFGMYMKLDKNILKFLLNEYENYQA